MAIQVDVYNLGGEILEAVATVPAGEPRAVGTDLAGGGSIRVRVWASGLSGLTAAQKKALITNQLKAARSDILAPVIATPAGVSFTI